MMPNGLEDLGFVASGLEDLGFVPHNEQSPQQSQQEEQYPANFSSNPFFRFGADVLAGMGKGGQSVRNLPATALTAFGASPETIQNIYNSKLNIPIGQHRLSIPIGQLIKAQGETAPDMSKMVGINDPNILDKLIQEGVPYSLLAAATGGASLPSAMRGGAIAGGILNEESPLLGSTIGAALPPALKGAGMAIKPIAKGVGALGKRLTNINPAKYEREFARHGTNEYLEQIAKPSSEIYQNIENKTSGQPLSYLEDTLDKLNNISPEAQNMYASNSSLSRVRNAFDKNREYKTAHKLWKTLGDEYRDLMKTKAKAGSLNTEQGQKVDGILQERKVLNSFINENVEGLGLKGEFQKANLLHRKDVIPARNEATIVNDYINTEGKVFDKRGLTNSLSKASSKNAMFRKPMPKETLNLNKRYEQSLNNMELLKKLGWIGAGTLGVGSTGKYLFGGR